MSIIDRQKNILHIPDKYKAAVLPAPKSVKIELTSKCNYRCKFCAYTLRENQPNADMDFGLFKSITKEMKEIGVEDIGLFYIGEPFTSPDILVDAIRYLKKDLGIPYVFLTSNGSIADEHHVKLCMEAGLDSLKWSCNAADEWQFAELMGVSWTMFHRAKRNIEMAFHIRNAHKYSTKLYASSIKYDGEQQKKMNTFLASSVLPYVDMHYWLPLYSAGGEAIGNESELGYKPIAGNTGRVDDPSEPIPCWTIFTAAHILHDGRMTACCLDGTGKWVMGDLKAQPFMEAWNSEGFIKLRQAHLDKNIEGTVCEKCALYK